MIEYIFLNNLPLPLNYLGDFGKTPFFYNLLTQINIIKVFLIFPAILANSHRISHNIFYHTRYLFFLK